MPFQVSFRADDPQGVWAAAIRGFVQPAVNVKIAVPWVVRVVVDSRVGVNKAVCNQVR
jgi:hypothetical protein